MESIFLQLLILMVVIWSVAVALRRFGLPTIMGELLGGVIVGPAVLGWVQPNEIIEVLAQMGIFFLMLHAGVETAPREFFRALRISWGVAVVGAVVPFSVGIGVALLFDLPIMTAIFVGLVMTATAVVVTLKILQDLGLQYTRMARVIVAASVIDVMVSLIMFSIVLGFINSGAVDLAGILWIIVKVLLFFSVTTSVGYYLYPLFEHPFHDKEGKGFTFVLILGLCAGLFADAIGLHIILGAYMAGLFFDEKVASKEVTSKVTDRLYAIAYSFLGPIFFISLGFHIVFDPLIGPELWFILVLTSAIIFGQVVSAGCMARLLRFTWIESLTVGIGMCGRAEMAFILASIGFTLNIIDSVIFTVLISTTFLLNIFASIGLKACQVGLRRTQ